MPGGQLVAAGTAALEAGRWAEARAAFESVLAAGDRERCPAQVWDGLAEALWWQGEPRASVECRERAYVAFRRGGDPAAAASAAMEVCVGHLVQFGNAAAASGWLGRARSVFPDAPPPDLEGWFWLLEAYVPLDVPADHEAACSLIRRALERGRHTGDVDLELSALADLGSRLVHAGHASEGFALIDQAMAGTLGGECRRLRTAVWAACTMLEACEETGDVRRAAEWLAVADDLFTRYGCPFLFTTCRTHYGGLLVTKGRWAEAERELAAAVRMAGGAGPVPHALALGRLADLRLRQGRLEEAEALARGCDDALLAAELLLARGEAAAAVARLQACLAAGASEATESAVLDRLVEALLALGDPEAAARSVERLGVLATRHPAGVTAARASTAAGRVAAARGAWGEAAGCFSTALGLLRQLELPFEAGTVQLLLARAEARTTPALAVEDGRAALAAFDRLGAPSQLDAAAALLRSLGVRPRVGGRSAGPLTAREREVLDLVATGLSNPEIAARLFISRKTAAHHVSSVLAKLGVRSRAEAVAVCVREEVAAGHAARPDPRTRQTPSAR
ncbi:LuxR family transcriptional regulator [Geodermatophilus marinus]|uniref:LuxR family transcriptional regulator n=1 Tax=Geodermatophilus sp. LHW52908 TaxID=2303986 RepID=UPI000E3BC2A7|nr:LuxR family transcriptional regulator [Geodermatophilus sp. LHW52908]RFU19089.1 LuxR family transcriptional regulator [Geodermatophilus sp. LHW52908]